MLYISLYPIVGSGRTFSSTGHLFSKMNLRTHRGSCPIYAVTRPCQTDIFSMAMLDPHLSVNTFNYTKTLGDYTSYRQRAYAHRERSEANKEALRGLACQEWRLNNGCTTFHEALRPSDLLPFNDHSSKAGTAEDAIPCCYQPGDLFGKKYVCGRCTGFYWDDWRTKQIKAHCGPDFNRRQPSPAMDFQRC
ncbi:Hypothetical protein DHA2_151445 [Giardia duodenalis]|uniref:Uncharacterized protein n=1 Tax=Giardia intestinalis TaxID=5741 RepID=V6TES3_GIAIN|nr:Hypothetical protein DHA2_151445 [Giardia intestinalis]